jgi:hypothetical protein
VQENPFGLGPYLAKGKPKFHRISKSNKTISNQHISILNRIGDSMVISLIRRTNSKEINSTTYVKEMESDLFPYSSPGDDSDSHQILVLKPIVLQIK